MSLCSELLSKPQQDRLSSASSSIVKRTLQWVLLLEEWRPVVLHKVSNTAKIARLMCTFLTGTLLVLQYGLKLFFCFFCVILTRAYVSLSTIVQQMVVKRQLYSGVRKCVPKRYGQMFFTSPRKLSGTV
jgi:hypothetical protein